MDNATNPASVLGGGSCRGLNAQSLASDASECSQAGCISCSQATSACGDHCWETTCLSLLQAASVQGLRECGMPPYSKPFNSLRLNSEGSTTVPPGDVISTTIRFSSIYLRPQISQQQNAGCRGRVLVEQYRKVCWKKSTQQKTARSVEQRRHYCKKFTHVPSSLCHELHGGIVAPANFTLKLRFGALVTGGLRTPAKFQTKAKGQRAQSRKATDK